jgi:MoaA/NifB/PqqE/SkfB family radical SAM enzyme
MSDFINIPFSQIKEIRDTQLFYNNIFQIHWILGRFCNYNCSYCWPDSHSLNKDEDKGEAYYTAALNRLIEASRNNGFSNYHLALSGGEPTIHPHIFPIIKQYSRFKSTDNVLNLVVVTNLSRSMRWWEQFVDLCKDMTYVTVVASWHREFAKHDQFIEKATFLMNHGINVSVNVTFSVDMFDEYLADSLQFQEAGLIVKALPQRTTNKIDYTQEQLDILQNTFVSNNAKRPPALNDYPSNYIKPNAVHNLAYSMELIDSDNKKYYVDYPERFPSLGFVNFKDWICFAGFQNACIDEFGNIRRGKAGCKDEVIGNIFNDEKVIFSSPQLCNKSRCDAATDSINRKIRISQNHNILRESTIKSIPITAIL